ncbi:SDR family NAD(P)-dependent oxidoreductase [Dietzia sp.]|uniref:SDR family NAD(P)-dependent oxidoreductase n=1 Tax=Dietzia sp. TaxID=1871616 RepID=UPI002FDA2667
MFSRNRDNGSLDLRGKTVLITGAGGGIGAALARTCHRRGARVAVIDIDGAAAESVAAELGGGDGAIAAQADVRRAEDLQAAASTAVERFGGIDVAVANAGITPAPATLRQMDPETMRTVLDVNVMGVLNTVQATADEVVGAGGHIQITGSCSAFMPGPGGSPYMASKSSVEAIARALRLELSVEGTSVGLAMLGMIDTPLAAKTLDEDPFGRALDRMLPGWLGRRLPPDDAAEAIARQIESRRARMVAPKAWLALDVANGLIPYVEGVTARDRSLRDGLESLSRRSAARHSAATDSAATESAASQTAVSQAAESQATAPEASPAGRGADPAPHG